MASFASPSDLATLLRQDVDTASAQQALDLATGRIKSRTGQDFAAAAGDVIVLEGNNGLVRLPQRPVTAVTLVETSGGYAPLAYTAAPEGTMYSRIGAELTWLGCSHWPALVRVTYDHGYATIPDDVRECCLELAREKYENPSGLGGETVDDYTWRAGSGAGVKTPAQLLDDLVAKYKVRVGSVILR